MAEGHSGPRIWLWWLICAIAVLWIAGATYGLFTLLVIMSLYSNGFLSTDSHGNFDIDGFPPVPWDMWEWLNWGGWFAGVLVIGILLPIFLLRRMHRRMQVSTREAV